MGFTVNNIIFLDIDGVLNSERSMYATNTFVLPYTLKGRVAELHDFGLDPIAVGMLKKMCKECDCKIVISSSWGDVLQLHDFIHIFNQYNFDTSSILIGKISHDSSNRGVNIKNWLNNHATLDDKFVIVDDSTDIVGMKNAILVDPNVGLSITNVQSIYTTFNVLYKPAFSLI